MVKPLNNNSLTDTPEYYMSLALNQARLAASLGEVPVGAVIVKDGEVIAEGCNRRETDHCATYHAEVMAIEQACKKLGSWRLSGCDLYVTLEPCPMCAGAIINARVSRVYIGALDEKAGAVRSVAAMFEMPFNHRPAVKCGILQQECTAVLADFFASLRKT
nr:nucleoside deaminase [Acetanaerobacterium elongatum]